MTISPVAGIDVSKEYSDFCILTPDRTVFSRGKVFHHPTSMDKLIKQLEDVENAFDMKPVCIMESTAYYHRILYRYLTKHKYKVIVINALQSKAASNFNIRSAKTDKIDAYKLATKYGMTNLKPSIMLIFLYIIISHLLLQSRLFCSQFFRNCSFMREDIAA